MSEVNLSKASQTTGKELKLQVGKKYKTREGCVVEIVEIHKDRCLYPYTADTGNTYRANGVYFIGHNDPRDIVEELPDLPPCPTPQPGEVPGLQLEVGCTYLNGRGELVTIDQIGPKYAYDTWNRLYDTETGRFNLEAAHEAEHLVSKVRAKPLPELTILSEAVTRGDDVRFILRNPNTLVNKYTDVLIPPEPRKFLFDTATGVLSIYDEAKVSDTTIELQEVLK